MRKQRNLLTFDQNIHTVYLNIRAVYPNKYHVTTHPEHGSPMHPKYSVIKGMHSM